MTDFQEQSYRPGERRTDAGTPPPAAPDVGGGSAVPAIPTPREDEPTILGFPAVAGVDDGDERVADRDAAAAPPVDGGVDAPVRLVVLERADPVAGVALVLAGAAAVVSLWLPWRHGEAATGWSLAWRGLVAAGSGVDELGRSGHWQPLAIVLGGALLLLLGVLLFLPERTHRFVGVLALLVASVVAAGILSLVAHADWRATQLDRGAWCAIAVGALGLLGALKAMLTVPRVTMKPRRVARR